MQRSRKDHRLLHHAAGNAALPGRLAYADLFHCADSDDDYKKYEMLIDNKEDILYCSFFVDVYCGATALIFKLIVASA